MTLIAVVHQCQLSIAEYGRHIWLKYDFGANAEHLPYLTTEVETERSSVDIRSYLQASSAANADLPNVFVVRLVLTFEADEARVESFVEAHLEDQLGRFGPGSHVLYERRSEGLGFDEAMTVAASHVDALYDTDDYPPLLGMTAR
ncbi:hypothetical protein [Micromonospora sp. DT62]|uniref:hypothetical protein n=1 Tax=Micromonospora sp. DT62 TaxID=3416521 RepID=UPI003CF81DDE